jgi:hypothetical protein
MEKKMNPQDPTSPVEQSQPTTPPAGVPAPPQGVAQPSYQPQQTGAVSAKDEGQGFGIAALVTGLLGFGLVSIVLGIIGLNKSKKSGHSNVMAIIGIVLGGISMLAVLGILITATLAGLKDGKLSNSNGSSANSTLVADTKSKTRLNAAHSKLEEYYNENASYPTNMIATNFPGIDSEVLLDVNGKAIEVRTSAKTILEAKSSPLPTADAPYQYVGYDCTSTGCNGYILRANMTSTNVSTANPYVKESLNTP